MRDRAQTVLGVAIAAWVAGCGDRTGLLVPSGRDTSSSSSRRSTVTLTTSTSTTLSSTSRLSSSASMKTVVMFASGPDWASFVGQTDGTGMLLPAVAATGLGPAADVCLTPESPANCPPGAVVYGTFPTAWAASSALPQAHWIWRPDVNVASPGDLQAAEFVQDIVVGPGATGSIQIAVDDLAVVYLNSVRVGSIGSVTDAKVASQAENAPVVFDLTPALTSLGAGQIAVEVLAQNGPSNFGNHCPPQGCSYTQNPAGVIFAGQIAW